MSISRWAYVLFLPISTLSAGVIANCSITPGGSQNTTGLSSAACNAGISPLPTSKGNGSFTLSGNQLTVDIGATAEPKTGIDASASTVFVEISGLFNTAGPARKGTVSILWTPSYTSVANPKATLKTDLGSLQADCPALLMSNGVPPTSCTGDLTGSFHGFPQPFDLGQVFSLKQTLNVFANNPGGEGGEPQTGVYTNKYVFSFFDATGAPVNVSAAPEPVTFIPVMAGTAVLLYARRRRQAKS